MLILLPRLLHASADACEKGAMIGGQVEGMRVVITDGQAHAVDSSDLAFRLAAAGAVRTAMKVSVLVQIRLWQSHIRCH